MICEEKEGDIPNKILTLKVGDQDLALKLIKFLEQYKGVASNTLLIIH